jgi:hypothetical protein
MVSFNIVSEYSGFLEPVGGKKIPGGPLYDLSRIQRIAGDDGGGILLWTRRCINDVASLKWDMGNVAELLGELRQDAHYKDSEWCENGKGAWAASDAYVITRPEWVPTAKKTMSITYFVKFAIAKTGTVVLTVSCHT